MLSVVLSVLARPIVFGPMHRLRFRRRSALGLELHDISRLGLVGLNELRHGESICRSGFWLALPISGIAPLGNAFRRAALFQEPFRCLTLAGASDVLPG
jgi:hypothetical protein